MVEDSSPLLPTAEESIEAKSEAVPDTELGSRQSAPKPASPANFGCACEENWRGACVGELFYKEYEGKRYCVLHYPAIQKAEDFKRALSKKLDRQDFNFSGVWFPADVSFGGKDLTHASFIDTRFLGMADFGSVTFSDVNFWNAIFDGKAGFVGAIFKGSAEFFFSKFGRQVDFCLARFNPDGNDNASASFSGVTFTGDTTFLDATFNCDVFFTGAKFEKEADFYGSTFSGKTWFLESTFRDYLTFKPRQDLGSEVFGEHSSADFQYSKIEKPALVSFHRLTLRPHWFVNVDPRPFIFIDVGWEWKRLSIKQEIAALEAKNVESPNRLLAIACRQLAENAETNNRYEEASRFRYWAMELQRQEMDPIWKEEWYEFAFWRLDWWYWATSGYGERIVRAFLMLFGIWAVFILLYTQVGFTKPESKTPTATPVVAAESDTIGQPLPLKSAWIYSLAVMSLQKPEPKPLTGTAQTLVLLETILGPVQAALLALAIRRKFMR